MLSLMKKLPLLAIISFSVLLHPADVYAQASQCDAKRKVKAGALDIE